METIYPGMASPATWYSMPATDGVMSTSEGTASVEDLLNSGATTAEPEASAEVKDCTFYNFMVSTVCGGAFCLLGVVANSLSILVLRKDNTPTGFILLTLAVTDLLLVVTLFVMKGIPALCTYVHLDGFFEFYPYLLVYGWPTSTIIHTAGTWITVLVMVNRYIAVVIPHRAAGLISLKSVHRQVAALSLAAVLFTLPNYLDNKLERRHDVNDNSTTLIRVYTSMGEDDLYQALYKTTAYYVLVYALPLLVLFVLTILLIRTLRQADRRRAKMVLSHKDTSRREVTVVLIVVVLVFMVCQFLLPLRRVLEAMYDRSQLGCGSFYAYYAEVNVLMVQINSSVNFFIYCLFASKFRLSLRQLCLRKATVRRLVVTAASDRICRVPDTPPTTPDVMLTPPAGGLHCPVGGSTTTLTSCIPDEEVGHHNQIERSNSSDF